MTKVVAYQPVNMFDDSVWYGDVVLATSRKIVISDGYSTATYLGSFRYENYEVFGRLTGYTTADGGRTAVAVSDFSVDANSVFRALEFGSAGGAVRKILSGSDRITGSGDSDGLRGFGGDDLIAGRGGADRINGDRGDDRLDGDRGADRLSGGGGSDALFGGLGKDVLFGGAGRDTLDGGSSADTLSGGLDRDVFRFGATSGDDVIADFDNRTDRIEVTSGASDFEDLDIVQSGTSVLIRFGDASVEVEFATVRIFDESDFLFS